MASKQSKPRIFISHASEDWEIADALGQIIHKAFAGELEHWFSSDRKPVGGIPPGKRWEANIHEHLRESTVVLSLVTPRSKDRIWLYWEAAIASENCPGGVVPITLGVTFEELPQPLSSFQGVNGLDCDSLCSTLSKIGQSASLEAPTDYLRTVTRRFVRKVTPLIEQAKASKRSVLEDRELVTKEEFSEVVSRFERKLDSLVGGMEVPKVLAKPERILTLGPGFENAAREALALAKAGARLDLGLVRRLVVSLFNAGDVEQAVELQSYLAANRNSTADDYYNLGALLEECNRAEEAEEAYREAIEIDGSHSAAWCNLGLILSKAGRNEEAQWAYENALSADQGYALAWYELGLLHYHMGNNENAESSFRAAVGLKPEDSFAWNNLGILLQNKGQIADAEAAFRKATQHNSVNAAAWTNLGNVLYETGRKGTAERMYKRALKADPRYTLAWYNLASLLSQAFRLEEAKEACKKALKIDPEDADSQKLMARLLEKDQIS